MKLLEHSLERMPQDFFSLFLSCSCKVNIVLEVGIAMLDHRIEAMCYKLRATSWKEAGSLALLTFRCFHVSGINHLI